MAGDGVVVLADRHDAGALAVLEGLARSTGSAPLLVGPQELAISRWSHKVGGDGAATTTLVLPSGVRLADADVSAVFNRIGYLPVPRFRRSAERDREYAAMELQALVASWLAGLGERVVNRAGARATDAGPTSPRHWLTIAAAAGLPVAETVVGTSIRAFGGGSVATASLRALGPWVAGNAAVTGRVPVGKGWSPAPDPHAPPPDPDWEVVVAGDAAVGPLADRFGAACISVVEQSPCLLAGFRFAPADGEILLHDIVTRPALNQPWAEGAAVRLLHRLAAGTAPA